MPVLRRSEEFINLKPESPAAVRIRNSILRADLPCVMCARNPVRLVAPVHADACTVEAAPRSSHIARRSVVVDIYMTAVGKCDQLPYILIALA